MRILLLGEYSNVHATLASGLRALGHEVTVVSDGDGWKNYPRDIDVSRPKGRLAGLRLWMKIMRLLPRLSGYDVVQLINPLCFELKAERHFHLYNYLRRHNRHVVLCAMGMDYYWVSTCTFDKPLRYSDFNIGPDLRHDAPAEKERRDWLGTAKERLNRMIAADCDAIVGGLYEDYICYQPHFPEKTAFIPLPIVMPERAVPRPLSQKVKLFVGISRGRSQYKGTDIMLKAAQAVQRKYPEKIELVVVEGVPFNQYQRMMEGSDAIVDQLYSYTPSMNPLLAMSKGIVCIGGGEPENYEIIGENELRPIINVEPCYDSVFHEIEQLALHPERLPLLSAQSIEYVRRHHDHLKVAKQYLALYEKIKN